MGACRNKQNAKKYTFSERGSPITLLNPFFVEPGPETPRYARGLSKSGFMCFPTHQKVEIEFLARETAPNQCNGWWWRVLQKRRLN